MPSELPSSSSSSQEAASFSFEHLEKIKKYIDEGWHTLTRSMTNTKDILRAFGDTKINTTPIVYFPFDFEIPSSFQTSCSSCIELRHLPCKIEKIGDFDPDTGLSHHGLLYLPHPYVVPGGMFNEMYGWDSYFIVRGLIEQNKTETVRLALGMIENFFFQIEYYGGILNANRTYYLSRSQPPFLSSMLLELLKDFQTKPEEEEEDSFFSKTLQETLLNNGYKFIERELRECWLQPHRTYTPSDSLSADCILPSPSPSLPADAVLFESVPDSDIISTTTFSASTPTYSSVTSRFIPSLSRFHGGKGTPVVEMGHDNHYYDSVAKQAKTLEIEFLKEGSRQKPLEELKGEDLTEDFYIADRAMRESGFDVSFRFGPFSGATHHYLPVCLNSLLYKAERDLSILAKDEKTSFYWKGRADSRRKLMNKLLWDEEKGLFLDFNTRKQEQSSYEYLSTFYPLWVGLASQDQAEKVVSHLHLFEQPGGLACSPTESGAQWDLPYGWAPLHLITIEGLRKYGFETEANRLSVKFLSTILSSFLKDNTIREKYDVKACSAESHITIGYKENVVGFGWTNGVFLALLNKMNEKTVRQLIL